MLDQHTQDPTGVGRPAPAGQRGASAVRALRRAQPPPTGWRTSFRREVRFWGYLPAAAIPAAIIAIVAAIGVQVTDMVGFRLLVAFAIPVVAGLAVTASAAATNAAPNMSRHQPRTRC